MLDPESQVQGPGVLGSELAVVTDIGTRHARNEDAGAIARSDVGGQPGFALVVCDGVSSASSSDRLAAAAVSSTRDALAEMLRAGPHADVSQRLVEAIVETHADLCALDLPLEPEKGPPGATIVAALAWPEHIFVSWLGDSRAYWVTQDEAMMVTRDDALPPPHNHVITHCIGPLETQDDPHVIAPHVRELRPSTSGTLLLCSDGFWNYAPEANAVAALVRCAPPSADAAEVARQLVNYALERGGMDNVTVAVARVSQEMQEP